MPFYVLFFLILMNILSIGASYILYTSPIDEGKLEGVLFAIEYASYLEASALTSSLVGYLLLYFLTKLFPPRGAGLRIVGTFFIIGGVLMLISATAFAMAVIRPLPLLGWDISRLAPYMSLPALQAGVGLAILLIGRNRFRSSTTPSGR